MNLFEIRKEATWFIIIIIMCCLILGCNGNAVKNDEEDDTNEYYESFVSEMFFTYKVIRNIENDFLGLAILVNNNGTEEYVMFEDGKDYNQYIYEWFHALKIAIALKNEEDSLNDDQIEAYLRYVHCLPNCLNESHLVKDKIKETILESFYDWQDVIMYEPKRYYGYMKYPYSIHNNRLRSMVLCRVESENRNVPNGTLRIYFKNYYTERLENEMESLYNMYY